MKVSAPNLAPWLLIPARLGSTRLPRKALIELDGLPCVVRIGRFGAYLEAKRPGEDGEEELIKATLPQDLTPADLDSDQAELLLKQKADGPESLGEDPATGEAIYLLFGQCNSHIATVCLLRSDSQCWPNLSSS